MARPQKEKSIVITTTDSQKTNYLKTNLLKQIKNNFFLGAKVDNSHQLRKRFQNKNTVILT